MSKAEKPPNEAKKPNWLKRKVLWPLKSKMLRSLPMKVRPLFVIYSSADGISQIFPSNSVILGDV